jgi:hypothetical protein
MVPPVAVPGGKPVTAVPGLTAKSSVTTVGPVFVTVEAPRTAKVCAEPSGGADSAQARLAILNMQIANKTLVISKLLGWIWLHVADRERERHCRVDFEPRNGRRC